MFGFNTTKTNVTSAPNATQPIGGGFGAAATQPATGFGAGGGGFGAAATQPGTGFGAGGGGFGAAATQPGTGFGAGGGFGAAATQPGTGFGAGGGGFGAAATQPGTGFGAGGGFGAAATQPGTGFGAGGGFGVTNTANATRGFYGGFGSGGGGFGSFGAATLSAANTNNANSSTAVSAQNYPYPGIKGPGYSTAWSRSVDFARLDDNTVFESLPEALQQHLIELRTFMNTERAAGKAVYAALNETDLGKGTEGDGKGSYRGLVRRIAELQAGEPYAVAAVAVECARQEREAQAMVQRVTRFEADVRHYEQQVWTKLAEERPWATSSAASRAVREGFAGGTMSTNSNTAAASQRLIDVVEELGQRMEHVARQIDELALAVVPGAQVSSMSSATNALCGVGAYSTTAYAATTTATSTADTIRSVNAALGNELATLMQLSSRAAKLHTRSDAARALFVQQYGQEEADAIFAPPQQQQQQSARNGSDAGWRDDAAARREECNSALAASIAQQPQPQPPQAQAPADAATMQPFGTPAAAAPAPASAAPAPAAAAASNSNPFGGFGAAATTTTTTAGFAPTGAATGPSQPPATAPTFGFLGSAMGDGGSKRQADAAAPAATTTTTATADDLRRPSQRVR